MEYLGLMAIGMILCYSSYPEKIKKIELKIRKLERVMNGENSMSKMLSELVNKECILVTDLGLQMVSKREISCTVLEVDNEWIKISFIDKKGVKKTNIIRIDSIERFNLIEDNEETKK